MKVIDGGFDVIVVGAGPVGSVLAESLARRSLRVALLEEHAEVGLPNHCSGLVSPRTLEVAGVSVGAVEVAHYTSARVWGPGGDTLWLRSRSVQAVAIDRTRFDQILAERAANAGATLMLNTQAHRFARSGGEVEVEARSGQEIVHLHAPLLVGADGASSPVARWLGLGRRHEIVPAVKADICFRGRGTDSIEILLGRDVAPGWFAWIIPLPDGTARIGTGATRQPQRYFESFLDLVRCRFGDFDVLETRQAPLPLGPARHFVQDHVMLVGAAARQTKPTTGGGLYFGIRAARMAAATAVQAIGQGDCSQQALAQYERAWHRLDGRELAHGAWLRRGFRRLPDKGFDTIIRLLNKPQAQRWISSLGDMDFPSRLLSPGAVTLVRKSTQVGSTESERLAGMGA